MMGAHKPGAGAGAAMSQAAQSQTLIPAWTFADLYYPSFCGRPVEIAGSFRGEWRRGDGAADPNKSISSFQRMREVAPILPLIGCATLAPWGRRGNGMRPPTMGSYTIPQPGPFFAPEEGEGGRGRGDEADAIPSAPTLCPLCPMPATCEGLIQTGLRL